MNRFLLLAGLLLAVPALAQSPTRVGPLSVQNRLGEIASDGTGAQATARANLGLSGVPLTVPTSPLLGGAPGAFVPLGIGAGLTGAGSQLSVVYGTGANTALQGSLRGVANGVAGLDAGGLVPLAQLPSLSALGAAATANNLSDLANAATARSNLGLGTIATQGAGAVAITGGTIAATPVSGASGAFSTLSASGTVSGAGITALLAPYAPLASPGFTGTVNGAAMALTGNATVGGTLGVTGATTLTGDLLTAGRFVASSGSLRFVNNGANGWNFQNAAGGSAFTINGSASALANQVTMVPQVAGTGPSIVATGTDTNIALKLQSKGTGAVQVNLSPFSVTPGALTFANGSAPASSFSYTASASGALNTANPNPIVAFSLNGDTVSKDLNSGFFPFISVIKNWGGGSQQGQQQAFRVNMVQTGAVTGYTPPVNMQMVGTGLFADYSFNVGGTAPSVGNSIGAAYAMAVTTQLHPGATNYTLASNIEWDIEVDATQQNLTLGGTVTAGDTITLTYTSASIVGSPVSVVATAGTGDLLQSLVNKLASAVNNNAALANAGVSAQPDITTNGVVNLFWQTQNTTTIGEAVGGSATETAVLGSVVTGASAANRSNNGYASRGAGRAALRDAILDFGTLNATHGSSALTWFNLGFPGGVFPIAPGGSLMTINLQQMQAAISQPVWSPQLGRGFDLRLINWTQYSGSPFLSPGFNVSGTGNLNLQNAVISVTATGLVLDVPSGRIGTGNPAIVSGGGGGAGGTTGNYFVGEIVQGVNGTDLNGGQYLITSVNASTGAVSPGGLTTLVQPSTATTSLGVAIATIGGSGLGLTITPTAANNNGIALAPSGGPTTVGGSLAVTGVLTALTPAVDTNTTQAATTAFVLAQASAVLPLIDGTATAGTSTHWSRDDHKHPTDTTRAGLASSPVFSSAVTVGTNATTQLLQVNGPAGVSRNVAWQTAGVRRWQITTSSTAEGGANVGSDLQITASDDAGAGLFTPITLTRSTGLISFATAVKFAGSNIVANGAIATTMTSLGPTGSHATIQEWLTVQNSAGTTRYIPLY